MQFKEENPKEYADFSHIVPFSLSNLVTPLRLP